MLQAQNLDNELYSATALLNDLQKQAMLTVAHAFMQGEEQSETYHWEDDAKFVAELESRWADYKNGGKVYSAEK
jgi:hypothetical protein